MNPTIAQIGTVVGPVSTDAPLTVTFPSGLQVGQGLLILMTSYRWNTGVGDLSTIFNGAGFSSLGYANANISDRYMAQWSYYKIATQADVDAGQAISASISSSIHYQVKAVAISINNAPKTGLSVSNSLANITPIKANTLFFNLHGSYRGITAGAEITGVSMANDNPTFNDVMTFNDLTYVKSRTFYANRSQNTDTGIFTVTYTTSPTNASHLILRFETVELSTITTDEGTTFLRGFTNAKLGGNVTGDGGGAIIERGFVYGLISKSAPGNVAPASSGYDNNTGDIGIYSIGAFTKAITGLKPNTTYYVRAYSKTIAGYSYGDEKSFTTETPSLPTSIVKEVTSIAQKSASVLSNIASNGGEPTNDGYGLVYGETSQDDPGNVSPASSLYDDFIASISSLSDVLKTSWTTEMEKTTYTNAGNTTHTITLPTIQEGDVVILLLAFDANPTITSDISDWTVVSATPSNTGKLLIMKAKYKMTSITITLGSSEACDAVAYRLRGNNLTYSYQTGTSSNPTPSVAPGVGSAKMAIISALVGFNTGTVTIASYPAGYTDTVLQVSGVGTAYTGIASAYKEANISSETPGSYSFGSAPTSWLAVTIMVWDKEQEFTQLLSNLDAGIEYYLRAYTKNGIGYDYSDEISFITLPYPPKVISINPVASLTDSDPVSVTITGEHFTPETTVKIDGVDVSDLVIVDNETITCTLPSSATPKVSEIEVENLEGKKAYTSFSYIDVVPPTPQPSTVSASFSVKGIGVLR